MKFLTLNVLIIFLILCLSKCSNSLNNNKKDKNINSKEKSEIKIEKPKRENISDKILHDKLEKLSKKEDTIIHQNDKLIEKIKESKILSLLFNFLVQ